jgi:hypothetical protein
MLSARGIDPESCTFNESMPDERIVMQGEVLLSENHYELTYSCARGLSMREALENAQSARGLRAKMILAQYLDPASLDDLQVLLAMYPDSVVEFSTYECNVGNIAGRNAIFWEVRNY